jgi:hypothetical protein
MLSPRLTDCVNCSSITALLSDIDCKLVELSNNLYNNISYILNKPIPSAAILDLLNYKRILTFKLCNEDYAKHYTVEMIASRVKLLKFKQ